jgi:hypothetical protein
MLSYCFPIWIAGINRYLFIPKQPTMSHNAKLHWFAASSQQGYDLYELWNDNQRLLTLYLNQFSQTAKVECENSRRNFKIEKEGFRRSKTILKNEYGVKIGELNIGSWFSNEGSIDLNGEKLHYTIQNNGPTELLIYKSSKKTPLLSCDIPINEHSSPAEKEKYQQTEKYSCLLMALGWFLFMPMAKEYTLAISA